MKPKKNPKVDLNRNSGLYFVIGLTTVLFFTWRMLEIKTYPQQDEVVQSIINQEEIEELIPLTRQLELPPPPPPANVAPETIQVVENENEIEESTIQSSESDQDLEVSDVVAVDDVEVEEEAEIIVVPFAVIEEVPIFPGCEGMSRNEQVQCFNRKMQEHIKKNLKYPKISLEMGVQGRVFVQFTIDETGQPTNFKFRSPDLNLEKESRRIMKLLPKMKPGRQRDKNVRVNYALPINYVLQYN
ncbi:energy transducer TonB [Spongiivirga sp. MCCC 1A20706]|uniref:energy transducer TonB n=1 Tax=Spongiivirga sp. MCCC 1A20706 TaxID=3160963 RepID=UPI0039772CE8